jgi:hypothetical protein
MLNPCDLTVFKNTNGLPTALGYPINSILLQKNQSLFMSGGGGSANGKSPLKQFENLAIPAGLICMNKMVCVNDSNSINAHNVKAHKAEAETIPESLFDKLFALAEAKLPKKMTRRHISKNKTTRKHK